MVSIVSTSLSAIPTSHQNWLLRFSTRKTKAVIFGLTLMDYRMTVEILISDIDIVMMCVHHG